MAYITKTNQILFLVEAIVIVLQSTLNEIQKTLVDIHGVKMKLIFEPIPDNDLGTADSLRNLKGKIKVSFIFLPLQLFFWIGHTRCPTEMLYNYTSSLIYRF